MMLFNPWTFSRELSNGKKVHFGQGALKQANQHHLICLLFCLQATEEGILLGAATLIKSLLNDTALDINHWVPFMA